jgi:hypothetical protein
MVGERGEEGSVVYAIHFLFCPNIEGLQINLSELWKGFFLPSFEYADPSDLSTYTGTHTLPSLLLLCQALLKIVKIKFHALWVHGLRLKLLTELFLADTSNVFFNKSLYIFEILELLKF